MSNAQTIPLIDKQIIIPATASTGNFVYNMQGIDRASLQINSTFSVGGSTGVVTLQISNDGVHYVPFAVTKTVTLTGGTTDSALFELGAIDYVFLQVSTATPSAGTLALQGVLYGTGGSQVW